MKSLARIISTLVLALLTTYFMSCASPPKKEVAVYEPPLLQFQQQLNQGNFQQVLISYKAAYEKHPDSQLLVDNYLQTIEKIKTSADKAYREKNYTRAEKIYSLLLENLSDFKKIEKPLPFSPKSLRTAIKKIRIIRSQTLADKYFKKGDFQKVIDSYTACLKNYPDDSLLLSSFLTAIENIKKSALKAFSNEEFSSAGKAFYVLTKNYKNFEKNYKPLSFSLQFLEDKINTCRLELTKKGLEYYRKGKLAEAISIWNDILAFDPTNSEIKKAVATAQAQLKKIKKK